MYGFTDTNAIPEQTLGLAMSFGGVYFEEVLSGYKTLNVGGRELIGNELETATGKGKDGVTITGQTLPPRPLTIQYKLDAKTDAECRHNFETLNFLLRKNGKNNVAIQFTDEPGRTYTVAYNQLMRCRMTATRLSERSCYSARTRTNTVIHLKASAPALRSAIFAHTTYCRI